MKNYFFFLMLMLTLLSSCISELSNSEKSIITQQFESPENKNGSLKINEIKQVGKTFKGKYFQYKTFEIKALVMKNCSANLIPNVAVGQISTFNVNYGYNDENDFKKFNTGEEIKIKGVLFLNDESFNLPDISNCIFFLDLENKPNNLPSSACIDGNKYYNLSLVFIKYKNPDIYKEISDNNFALSTVDQNGLFYCGAVLQDYHNYNSYDNLEIDKSSFLTNRRKIWFELFCNFERSEIICKN
jgi:hypothetical protein